MPDLWVDVDTAVILPVNIMPIVDSTDFKTIEDAVAYDGIASGGMELVWNFMPCSGTVTAVAVTPTTGSNQDWVETVANRGMYSVEMPASGGADINNGTEGVGWFTGEIVGALPFRGPTIGFRRAALNDLFIEGGTASTNLEDFFDGTGYAGGTARLKVDVDTLKTQAITCGAAVTIRADVGAAAAPGAANGMLIGGSNDATTFSTLSVTGQLDAGNLLVDGTTVLTGATTLSGDVTIVEEVALSKSLTVTGVTVLTGNVALADGITVAAPSTGNRAGVEITGNGTGAGVKATGGATGPGMLLTGGGNHADADGLRTVAGGALALDLDSTVVSAILTDTGTTLDALIKYIVKILGNKIAITDADGATVLYDDDGSTPLKTCTIADNATTTTRGALA